MTQELIKYGEQFNLIVADHEPKQRIDLFLHNQFPLYSRSFFQRLIDDGLVSINQKPAQKAGHIIKPGDMIDITFPSKRSITADMVEAKQLPVSIIAKHPHFIIINKPAGLLVHPTTSTDTSITLADWLLHNIKGVERVGYVDRPGIIHRLDKLTSGLMIIPRTNYAYAQFGTLFRNRAIEKVYYAVVKGHPPKMGTIDTPIARHPIERTKMATFNGEHQTNAKLRHAVTHYEVVQYFEDAALVRITLETGRTHQIRVHFASIGHPVIGDIVYGTQSKQIKRQALHAQGLYFTFDGNKYRFESELPEDMKKLIKDLKPIT